MTDKIPAGMERLNVSLPAATLAWFRRRAELEGVPMQSLIAPVLNAVARGEIQGGYALMPEPHGNTKVARAGRQ